jgi:hypothetical protein
VRIARQQPFDLKGRGAGVGRVLGSDAEWDAAAPAVSALGIAGDVLHDRIGALADERDGHRVGTHAVARGAAGAVGGVEEDQ